MNLNQHFREIESAYAAALPEWMEKYEATGRMHHDVYLMEWQFSPIELGVWSEIRQRSMPFYPQMPACGYFLDFANPFLKIAIECDGKAFHDKERDRARDARLAAAGWMVFRLEGHECKRQFDIEGEYNEPTRDQVLRYFGVTSAGLLDAIRWAYFSDPNPHDAATLMQSTLSSHRSTPETFPSALPLIEKTDGPRRIGDLVTDYIYRLERRAKRQA